MTQDQLFYIELAKAAAPFLAALTAAGIAAWVAHKFGRIQEAISRQQAETSAAAARTARNKLRLDLFDRRMVVYEAASNFLSRVLANGRSTSDADFEYLSKIQGARWLFDEAVVEYLQKELWELVTELHLATVEIDAPVEGEARINLAQKRSALFIKAGRQRVTLDEVFGPYLKMES